MHTVSKTVHFRRQNQRKKKKMALELGKKVLIAQIFKFAIILLTNNR